MKALQVDHWGPPSDIQLVDIAAPAIKPGHVRIRVRASSVNFADILMVQGLYQEKPPFPFTPGSEISGDIIEVGEGVVDRDRLRKQIRAGISGLTDRERQVLEPLYGLNDAAEISAETIAQTLAITPERVVQVEAKAFRKLGIPPQLKVGMRVAGLVGLGGFAEEVVTAASSVMPIPDSMDYASAAAFTIVYGTSHVGLAHRAQLKAGETLLVHGAAGGVGLAAVELGKLMGATVIATASSAEKLALTQQYGADHIINYTEEDFRTRVKEITGGKGANVIYDPVGGDVFDQSLRCIAWEGRLLVVGFASGRIPKAPANLTLVKNCSVVGLYWGAYMKNNPAVLVNSLQQLMGWYAEGKLKPHVSATYPMAQIADAMGSLSSRKATGKVVITID